MSTLSSVDDRRVDDLVAGCMELPTRERDAWLAEECGGNEDLRDEVERLLVVRTSALWRAEQSVFEFFTDTSSRSPETLGPYRLEGEIGVGGTARVYRARRMDSGDAPRVAIKLLSYGVDDEDVLRRFRREGDILARLDHPNIARVLGGGIGPDHRPYWVMELIEGRNIRDHCRDVGATPRDCARWMCDILSGLAYAHRKLIVHRDLKPENLLMTADGRLKILDFGIAKLLDPNSKRPRTVTVDGRRMLTPEYAAPEELAMAESSTAADVYSCGVVLFELLASRRPFSGIGEPAAFLKAVLEQEPAPPSRHAPGLPRDLDAIVLQALQKSPGRRYSSVEAFRLDLVRYLENRPVRARAGGMLYRFGKLVRRHYRGMAALILALLVGSTVMLDRERSRLRLEQERNEKVQVVDSVTRLFSELDPYVGGDSAPKSVEELLEGALEKLYLDEAPLLKAGILRSLGRIHGNQGRREEGLELLKKAYEVYRAEWSPRDLRLAEFEVLLGDSMAFAGHGAEAEPILRRAVERMRDLEGAESFKRLEALLSLGRIHQMGNDFEAAQAAYRDVVDFTGRAELPTEEARSLFIESRMLHGSLFIIRELYDLAEAPLREAHTAAASEWGGGDPRALYVENLLAKRLFRIGRRDESLRLMEEVLQRRRQVLGDDHLHVAESLCQLGGALVDIGNIEEAGPYLARALQIYEALGNERDGAVECRQKAVEAGIPEAVRAREEKD